MENSKAYAESIWGNVLKTKELVDNKPQSTLVTSQGDVNADILSRRNKIDGGTAMMLANQDIYDAASRNSKKDALIEYKANPFSVVALKHQNRLKEISAKESADKRVNIEDYKLRNKVLTINADGSLQPNVRFTQADKLKDQSFTADEKTNILAGNLDYKDKAFEMFAKPGIEMVKEFLAKQADAGNVTKGMLQSLFVNDADIKRAMKLAIEDDRTKEIVSVEQGEQGYGVYRNDVGPTNTFSDDTPITGEVVRNFLNNQSYSSMEHKELATFFNRTQKLARDHVGDMGSADNYIKKMKEENQGGLMGYIELLESSAYQKWFNKNEITKFLKGSTEADKFVEMMGGGDEMLNTLSESFLNVNDNSKLSEKSFGKLVKSLVMGEEGMKNDKSTIQLPLYHDHELTVHGITGGENYLRRGPGVGKTSSTRRLRFENFNDHDWNNVDAVLEKTMGHFIDDYLTNGFLNTSDGKGKKTNPLGKGKIPDIAIVNYRNYIAKEYAQTVNKVVDLNANSVKVTSELYKDYSKMYAQAVQSKTLKSYVPLTMDKLNAYGINDVIGYNVNLAAAMGEGVDLFIDAKQRLDREDFTVNWDDPSNNAFGLVMLGMPINKTAIKESKVIDKAGWFTGDEIDVQSFKNDANKAGVIMDDLESEIGAGWKGAEGENIGSISIGAVTQNVLEDPNKGAVVITNIPYDWLYKKYVKTVEGENVGMLTASEARGIATEGISFIKTWDNLKNYSIMQDAQLGPLEMALNSKGKVSYVDNATNAGAFKFTTNPNPSSGIPHIVTGFVQTLDEKGKWSKVDISNMLPDQKYNLAPLWQNFIEFITTQNIENEKMFQYLKNKGITVSQPPDIPWDY